MSRAPVRRAHLVSPFGTGALLVAPDGTSMVAAGLDHWYERDGDGRDTAERRRSTSSASRSGASSGGSASATSVFRPTAAAAARGQQVPNVRLTVPFLRFPQWHFCPRCKRLADLPLTAIGRQKCRALPERGQRRRSWLRCRSSRCATAATSRTSRGVSGSTESAAPPCTRRRSASIATGGATLANQIVKCECGEDRTLSRIVEAAADGSSELS